MTDQHAGVRCAIVGDGQSGIGCDDVDIEVDQPFATDGSAGGAHAMGGVADRAAEPGADVVAVMIPACVLHNLVAQVVAFLAESVGANGAQIGRWKENGNGLAGQRRLTHLVAAFENMCPTGTVRAVGAGSAEFSVVIAVVAVRAEDLHAHQAPLCDAVEVEHVGAQAWLRQRAAARVGDRMA